MPLLPNKLRKKDPSVVNTTTSYNAKGNAQADLNELGSSYKSLIPDPVPELASLITAVRTYKKMFRTDVSVRVGLRCGEAPVLGADYDVEPFDDSEDSAIQAEFLRANLFGTNWVSTLSQILKMYRDGFQVFEPVFEMRQWTPSKSIKGANAKNYTMLKRLAVRPVESLSDFEYDDNGNLTQLNQSAIISGFKTKTVTIPATKLIIFTFEKDGGDVRGESILRSAYPHWYYKQQLYAIDAISKERHGIGVPYVELQPGASKKDKEAAAVMAANLRTNEKSYIVTNTNIKVGFAELSGNPADAMASAMHHDLMIMKNILVQFLNSGAEGGRATSATALDMMMKAMRYIANYIVDEMNRIIVPQIIGYNFQTQQFPKIIVRNIGESKDLQMWSAAMSNLINSEAITVDDDTENWIRRQVDVPYRTTPRPTPMLGPHDTKELLQGSINGNGTAPPANGATNGAIKENAKAGAGSSGSTQTGNVGKSPSSGV